MERAREPTVCPCSLCLSRGLNKASPEFPVRLLINVYRLKGSRTRVSISPGRPSSRFPHVFTASGVEAPFYLLFREGGEGQPVLQGIGGNHRFLRRRPCSDWGLWIGRGQAHSVLPMAGCTWRQTSHRPSVALEQDVGPHPSPSFLPWSRTGQRGQCFPTFPPSPSPPLQTGPSDAHNLSGANASLIWGRAFRKNSYELCNALSLSTYAHMFIIF